jgi:hypothetical protein
MTMLLYMLKIKKCTGPCERLLVNNDTNFAFVKKSKYYVAKCKICVSEQRKQYRKNNKEKIKQSNKIWRDSNKDYIKQTNKIYYRQCILSQKRTYYVNNKKSISLNKKIYYQRNKTSIIAKNTIYIRKRRQNNIEYKLRCNLSKNITRVLRKYVKFNCRCSSILYLPYTFKALKEHIESLFEYWMTWDNWGSYNAKNWNNDDPNTWKWQLDHIIPQSELPYDNMEHPNFKKCWALDNLRPYSAKQNIIDGSTRIRHV